MTNLMPDNKSQTTELHWPKQYIQQWHSERQRYHQFQGPVVRRRGGGGGGGGGAGGGGGGGGGGGAVEATATAFILLADFQMLLYELWSQMALPAPVSEWWKHPENSTDQFCRFFS
jgi:hypothetical protein